jgi:hypothetical protein
MATSDDLWGRQLVGVAFDPVDHTRDLHVTGVGSIGLVPCDGGVSLWANRVLAGQGPVGDCPCQPPRQHARATAGWEALVRLQVNTDTLSAVAGTRLEFDLEVPGRRQLRQIRERTSAATRSLGPASALVPH